MQYPGRASRWRKMAVRIGKHFVICWSDWGKNPQAWHHPQQRQEGSLAGRRLSLHGEQLHLCDKSLSQRPRWVIIHTHCSLCTDCLVDWFCLLKTNSNIYQAKSVKTQGSSFGAWPLEEECPTCVWGPPVAPAEWVGPHCFWGLQSVQ